MAKRKFKIETKFNTDLFEIKEINELEGLKNALWALEVPYDDPEEAGPFSRSFCFKIKKGARIYQAVDAAGLSWIVQNGMPLEDYDAAEIKGAALDLVTSGDVKKAMRNIEPLFMEYRDWPRDSILVWNFDAIVDEYEGDEEMDFEDDAPEVPSKYVPMPLRIYRHYGSSRLDKGRSYDFPKGGIVPDGLWGIELDKLPLLKRARKEEPDALTEEVGQIVDQLCKTAEGGSQGTKEEFFDFRVSEDANILRLSGLLQVAPLVSRFTAEDCFKEVMAKYDGVVMEPSPEVRSVFPGFREWPEHSILIWNLDAVIPVGDAEHQQPEPGYVGQVGESVIIKAAAIYLATTWRSGRLYLIEDTDGNIYTVKTRRRLPGNVEPGTVTLRARVKNHVEYRGVKQTWVERARVI